jgi:hypothetical protein
LAWVLVAALLGLWAWGEDRSTNHEQDRAFTHGYAVRAEVLDRHGPDDEYPDVAYRHPLGGQRFTIHDVWVPDDSTSLTLLVDRRDPTHVRPAGEDWDSGDLWVYELPALGLLLLGWGGRRLKVRRARRVAGEVGVPTRMEGLPVAPRWWGGHWTLQLRPPDAPAGSPPTCSVPLVEAPAVLSARTVDAIGTLRRWRRVVAVDHETREVRWPAGRCVPTFGRRRSRHEPSRPMASTTAARLVLIACAVTFLGGIALDLHEHTGIDSEDAARSISVTVLGHGWPGREDRTLVGYRWLGEERQQEVEGGGSLPVGRPTPARIDPARPERVWLPGHDAPGGDGLSFLLYVVAVVLFVTGLILRWVQRAGSQRPEPPLVPPPHPPPPPRDRPVPSETEPDARGWVAVPPPPPGPTASWNPPPDAGL